MLESFRLGRDAIYTAIRAGFTTRAHHHLAGAGGDGQDMAPDVAGSTFLIGDPAHAYHDVWVTTSSWTEPPRVLAVSRDGRTRDTRLRDNPLPPGTPELEVSEVLVTSHDGATVPLVILRRKDLPMTGDNPTLLVGYGAYGFSFQAFFDPRSVAWLERGGVLALANVRGSGAFGDDWYRAGFKATKSNTWKDGVACARYLLRSP